MHWLVLIVSGLCEAVWATALSRSEGLTRLVPSLVFVGGCLISMGGLAYALREVPVGTGYAVWTAIGAAATVTYAMVTGAEGASLVKIVLLVALMACVVGLKLVSDAGH